MADCVLFPTLTVFLTPTSVQTVTGTISTLTTVSGTLATVPGALVTEVTFTGDCTAPACVSGTTTNIDTESVTTTTTSAVTDGLITLVGDPVPIETQYGSSCLVMSTPSTPTLTPTPDIISALAGGTPTGSSTPSSSAAGGLNLPAIIGGLAIVVCSIIVVLPLIFYHLIFRRCRRGGGKTSGRRGLSGEEKAGFRFDPESGDGSRAIGHPSNLDHLFDTPARWRGQGTAQTRDSTRDSNSAYFDTQTATIGNTVIATLFGSVSTSEKRRDTFATDEISTSSTSPTSSKLLPDSPRAISADQATTNTIAAALLNSSPTSDRQPDLIATGNVLADSTSPAGGKPFSSTSEPAPFPFPVATTTELNSSSPQPLTPKSMTATTSGSSENGLTLTGEANSSMTAELLIHSNTAGVAGQQWIAPLLR